jgi:hypothetical protein
MLMSENVSCTKNKNKKYTKLPLRNGNNLTSNDTQKEKINLKGYVSVYFCRGNSVSYGTS